jgi:hypothetical protein
MCLPHGPGWDLGRCPRPGTGHGAAKTGFGPGRGHPAIWGSGRGFALVPWERPRAGRWSRAWGLSGAGAWGSPGTDGVGRQCLSGVALVDEKGINLVGYGFPCEISRKLDS